MAVPLASSASASRSLRMICSGEWRMRFIGSPPALAGENDSHIGWTSLGGAGPDGFLQSLTEQADVFQLFWSSNSMRSHYVRREWEYAMTLGRDNFIRPTYWEDPLPAAPE